MNEAPKEKLKFFRIEEPTEKIEFPIIENVTIKAGFPSPALDYIQDKIDLNDLLIRNKASSFLAKSEGDSMIGSFMPSNSILIVDRSIVPVQNDIIVAVVDGDFTVKHFWQEGDNVWLIPSNEKYKPTKITDCMEFYVWGTVTKIIVDMRESKEHARPNRLQ